MDVEGLAAGLDGEPTNLFVDTAHHSTFRVSNLFVSLKHRNTSGADQILRNLPERVLSFPTGLHFVDRHLFLIL
jgi:hypothetical protein